MHFQICGNNDGNIIHVFKNGISISVATVLEVSKMTVPVCTSQVFGEEFLAQGLHLQSHIYFYLLFKYIHTYIHTGAS